MEKMIKKYKKDIVRYDEDKLIVLLSNGNVIKWYDTSYYFKGVRVQKAYVDNSIPCEKFYDLVISSCFVDNIEKVAKIEFFN